MNIFPRKGRTDHEKCRRSKRLAELCLMLILSIMVWSGMVAAQSDPNELASQQDLAEALPIEEPVDIVVFLPSSVQMAMALANPELRDEALLDLAAAKNTLTIAQKNGGADSADLVQNFLDDRGWLARMVQRYGWVEPHSAVLDPAAWLVLEELQQHDLPVMSLVHPDHTPLPVLVYQVFQRAAERLAAANLPILLLRLEAEAVPVWDAFLALTTTQDGPYGNPQAEWKAVETEWFTGRSFPFLVEPDDYSQEEGTVQGRKEQDPKEQDPKEQRLKEQDPKTPDLKKQESQLALVALPLAAEKLQDLSQLVQSAVDARPPDARRLEELRFSLLSEMPVAISGSAEIDQQLIRDILYLGSLVDGLQDGHYFDFVQGLLAITAGALHSSTPFEDVPLLVGWLIAELPAISVHYADGFAAVDPRLNTTMAAAYKVLQSIAGHPDEAGKAPRALLADAVAQLTLLIPDMGYYFNMPVRAKIIEEINVCTSIAASRDDKGYPTMTRIQYDACVEDFLQLADQETRLPELSGNFSGPFSIDSLRRELNVTPEQRINYAIGYLHNSYSTDCPSPATALPNPLEWAVLATAMAWFAEAAPEFFMTPKNETRLAKMRSIGEQLMLGLAEQVNCFAGTDLNDPMNRVMADYDAALRAFNSGIIGAEADFRTRRLRPDADIRLDQDASQSTAYRPDDLIISPCNPQNVCEMSGNLSTTRALIGLFPEEYLLAEQSGLGRIEICYRNMEWVERRSELVRPDDDNVANYFGFLGFDLVGRYIENSRENGRVNSRVNDLFGFRFTSPDEHHYLFAQASEDVLQDRCPVEWVGTRIITPLREDRGGIVPDRLTYLAASRTLPSRLLQANWDRGAEWRDWFVTGIGVSRLTVPPVVDIKTRLDQHLQSLYQAEQTEIYQRILLPNIRNSEGDKISLYNEMFGVSIAKALLHMQIMLFYPDSMARSDSIRMAIAGDAGLLERRTLGRFREDNISLTSVNRIARERLIRLQQVWSEQPEAVRREGSVSASLMHAMTRINILYRQFFISSPEPLEEIQVRDQRQDRVAPELTAPG